MILLQYFCITTLNSRPLCEDFLDFLADPLIHRADSGVAGNALNKCKTPASELEIALITDSYADCEVP